jgi:hypothetical protein
MVNTTIDVYINNKPSPTFKISYEATREKRTAENGIYTIIKSYSSDISDEIYTHDFENLKLFIYDTFRDNTTKCKSYTVSKINTKSKTETKTIYTKA